MIGNDVVDLLQSREDSNWQRKGYIEKIFNPEEQLYISNASNPEIMVWILWSMKEAAYKIYNRKTKVREYIPKKLNCVIESQNQILITGKVICLENTFYTKTILFQDHIHTVAVSLFDDLNTIIEIENKAIHKDKNGIPFLSDLQNIAKDVSISHHGRFEKVVTLSQP
jgi:phosphopantetheinyl transferase (holo-ACP synthase)